MSLSPGTVLRASLYARPSQSHSFLVPDRWAASGWKYVPSDSRPAFFRHRHRRKTASMDSHEIMRTTHQSTYIKHDSEKKEGKGKSGRCEEFPPLPATAKFIDKVMGGRKGRRESVGEEGDRSWVGKWNQRKSFARRRHRDMEWERLYQSHGTIHY